MLRVVCDRPRLSRAAGPFAILVAILLGGFLVVGSARAASVVVQITGEVEFNQVTPAPLGNILPGDEATLRFRVDSDSYTDSASFPTRGYAVIPASIDFTIGETPLSVRETLDPGLRPQFVIRDNDPLVDGFFTNIGGGVDAPNVWPLTQEGAFTDFGNSFSVTYGSNTLSSLDILDAVGMYEFNNLQVYNWTIDDGPFNPVGIVFQSLSIRLPPDRPAGDYNGDGRVDAADYTVWRDQVGAGIDNADADGNNDGVVNDLDYDIWRENFGQPSSPDALQPARIPEPASMVLLLVAGTMTASVAAARRCGTSAV